MIFKLLIHLVDALDRSMHRTRVVSVENGERLEARIDSILSNYKADGYKEAFLDDCQNISEPCPNR